MKRKGNVSSEDVWCKQMLSVSGHVCFTHTRCGNEAGQRGDLRRLHLPGHHQLGSAEIFVEAVLGDV